MASIQNIKIEPMKVMFGTTDLGFTDGDIEVKVTEDLVDVTAHQTGTNVLSQIRTGKSVEVTVTLKETTPAQIKELIEAAGDAFTPADVGATEVSGWGMSKDFTQVLSECKLLNLHPVVLGAAVLTRDYTFLKAYPMLDTLTFSGENIQTVPITFKCFPDLTMDSKVRYFVYGDGTQDFTQV